MNEESILKKNFTWINKSSLSREDRDFLEDEFGFHPLDIEDALNKVHPSKIDSYDDYLFLILHFPYQKDEKGRLGTAELNAFVGDDFLVLLHDKHLRHVDYLFQKCKKDEKARNSLMGEGPTYLLYHILDDFVDQMQAKLGDLAEESDSIDEEIFTGPSAETVERINVLRRNVVVFQTMVKPQLSIFDHLEKEGASPLNSEFSTYWGNIYDHLLRVSERLEDYRELVVGLSAANESLLSHRTNEIMRILTLVSVILLPLGLIAGIYGMNVRLPIDQNPFAFWIISSIMVIIVGAMVVYFKYKEWL